MDGHGGSRQSKLMPSACLPGFSSGLLDRIDSIAGAASVRPRLSLRRGLLDKTNAASGVWADTAYRDDLPAYDGTQPGQHQSALSPLPREWTP